MEVQRDGSLEKGSVDLVLNPGVSSGQGAGIDTSILNANNSNNHNTITYVDPADTSE